jgi:hypothetical protein
LTWSHEHLLVLAERPAILQLLYTLAQGLQFGPQLLKPGAPVRSRRATGVLLATGFDVHRFRSRT